MPKYAIVQKFLDGDDHTTEINVFLVNAEDSQAALNVAKDEGTAYDGPFGHYEYEDVVQVEESAQIQRILSFQQ